jgi:glucosylceramidase
MDYPPDWMLMDVQKRQDVEPRYYPALAQYYLRYVREYEKQGIFIDYLSLFNEPGIYTKIAYPQIAELLKNHVGPLFAREGVRTRLQLSEAPDRANAVKNYPLLLEDAEARKYVANLPFHGYHQRDYAPMAELGRRYADLPLWMTEVCHAYAVGTPRSVVLPKRDFADGEFWGEELFSDVEGGVAAWIYWNMILDEKGGPWLVSPEHHNPPDNGQHPVVMIDRQSGEVVYTGLYYYLSHFSRFVRPGAVRVETRGTSPDLRVVSFLGPDGRMVAVAMNHGERAAALRLGYRGRSLEAELPGHSIATLRWKGF